MLYRYVEGVHVLYGTNQFHFSGAALFQDLERPLLRPEHLALITSAEIRFTVGQVARPPENGMDLSRDTRFAGWRDFLAVLKTIPEALPTLRYLHVAPTGYWFPPQMARNDICRLADAVLLEPFDAMVQRAFETNPRLEGVYVAIPAPMLAARAARGRVGHGSGLDPAGVEYECEKLWRPIGSKDGEFVSRNGEPGYWLSVGERHGPPGA